MPLTEDLRAAIDKHLSNEVGSALKIRLQKADEDAGLLSVLRAEMTKKENRIAELEAKVRRDEEVTNRITALDKKEKEVRELLVDQRLVDLTMKHAEQRVADAKEIVHAVFANHHFKYQVSEGGSMPVSTPTGAYTAQQSFSRTAIGEGTGAPPPPPSGSPGT